MVMPHDGAGCCIAYKEDWELVCVWTIAFLLIAEVSPALPLLAAMDASLGVVLLAVGLVLMYLGCSSKAEAAAGLPWLRWARAPVLCAVHALCNGAPLMFLAGYGAIILGCFSKRLRNRSIGNLICGEKWGGRGAAWGAMPAPVHLKSRSAVVAYYGSIAGLLLLLRLRLVVTRSWLDLGYPIGELLVNGCGRNLLSKRAAADGEQMAAGGCLPAPLLAYTDRNPGNPVFFFRKSSVALILKSGK